jgi:hypothetical protein
LCLGVGPSHRAHTSARPSCRQRSGRGSPAVMCYRTFLGFFLILCNHLGFILIGFVGPLGFWVHGISELLAIYHDHYFFSDTIHSNIPVRHFMQICKRRAEFQLDCIIKSVRRRRTQLRSVLFHLFFLF